jgi:3-methyladenine DNA glycosylase AlkD
MSDRSACDDVLAALREQSSPENVSGMARFGINPQNTLGISVPMLRRYARSLGRDHALALDLWASGVHEARILAALVDEPGRVTPEQMDAWVAELDSWDVCDHACGNLFDRTSIQRRGALADLTERPVDRLLDIIAIVGGG